MTNNASTVTAMIAPRINTQALEARRLELGISRSVLAKRSGVSLATINRILSGDFEDARLGSIGAIADALGMSFKYDDGECLFSSKQSAFEFRRAQAQRKAERLAKLTQGTSALEGQAVAGSKIQEAIEQTVAVLVAGPRRRLWA